MNFVFRTISSGKIWHGEFHITARLRTLLYNEQQQHQRLQQSGESIDRLATAIDQSAQIATQVMAAGQQQHLGIA